MSDAQRNPDTSPEGREANRPPVRYGAPAAAVLRAQTAAPSQATLRVGMRLASVQAKAQRSLGGVSSEPCDRVGQRSARRLTLISHRTQAHTASDNPSLLSLLGVAVVGIVTFLALFGW